MLSQDLMSLRRHLSEHRHGGITLESEEVEAMTQMLRDCEDQAHQLEQAEINPQLRRTAKHLEDDKVILFPVIPQPTGERRGGGDVA